MRLNLKYPEERLPVSWDFAKELDGQKAKEIHVKVSMDAGSRVNDPMVEQFLDAAPWVEDGNVFQLTQHGLAGADYRIEAIVKREDGRVYKKISILPVRDA